MVFTYLQHFIKKILKLLFVLDLRSFRPSAAGADSVKFFNAIKMSLRKILLISNISLSDFSVLYNKLCKPWVISQANLESAILFP